MPLNKYGTSMISSNLQNCILGPGADGQVPSSRFMASIRFVDDQHIQHLETNQAGKGGETIPRDEICVQASHINVQNEETKRWGRLYQSG